jgi:hypothetical protein
MSKPRKPVIEYQKVDSDEEVPDTPPKKNITLSKVLETQSSDLLEINPSQFDPSTPDPKPRKISPRGTQSSDIFGNKDLKAIFDAFTPTPESERANRKYGDQEDSDEESDIFIEEAIKTEAGTLSWGKNNSQAEKDESFEENKIKVFNIHEMVTSKMLHELFCKGISPF